MTSAELAAFLVGCKDEPEFEKMLTEKLEMQRERGFNQARNKIEFEIAPFLWGIKYQTPYVEPAEPPEPAPPVPGPAEPPPERVAVSVVEIDSKVRGYQWVNWFPHWKGFGFKRMELYSAWACVYDWSLRLGWFELRKWATGKRIYRLPEADNE